MDTFTLTAQGPFALASSITFLEGFTPASYDGTSDRALELAFPVEGDWQSVGVRVRAHPHGVTCEILSPQEPSRELSDAVRVQVTRILSLDVDGSGFPGVGERDEVVAGLQRLYPSLRPVCFYSPCEAAAWAIIGHRIRMRQAAAIKARMAEQFGEPVSFDGHLVHAFPSPHRLAELEDFPGLTGRKQADELGEGGRGCGVRAVDRAPGRLLADCRPHRPWTSRTWPPGCSRWCCPD